MIQFIAGACTFLESNHYITVSLSYNQEFYRACFFTVHKTKKDKHHCYSQYIIVVVTVVVGEKAFWVSADQQHHSDPRKNNKSHNSQRSVDLSSSAKSTYCYKQLERMTDYVRKCLRQETENLVQGIQPSAVQKLICDRWFVNVSDSEPCSVPSSNTHRAPLISPFLISFSKYIGENPRLLSSDLLFHCVFRGRWEHAERKKLRKSHRGSTWGQGFSSFRQHFLFTLH